MVDSKRGGPYTCPDCGSSNIYVYDTLGVKADRRLIRKRKCEECGCRWQTVEMDVADVRWLDQCRELIERLVSMMKEDGSDGES